MDTIILNLADPSWWFTGLFFIVIALLVKPAGRHFITIIKKIFKGIRLKRLSKIRSHRGSVASVTYEIVRSHAYFVMFLLLCLLYLYWYTASPLSELAKSNPLAAAFLSLPIYIVEFVWLVRDSFARELVNEHNKLLRYARGSHRPDARAA